MLEPRSFKISMGIFPFDALVSVNQTDKQFRKDLRKRIGKKQFKKEPDYTWKIATAQGYFVMLKNNASVIRLRDFDPAIPAHHGVLIHELSHFMNRVFNHIGLTWTKGGDETYSYTLEHLVTKCLEKLLPQTNPPT